MSCVTEAASAHNLSEGDEQFYDFEDIVGHVWVGSRLFLEVKWKDDTSTLEPEKSLKEDDPPTLASYLQRSGLSSRSKRCQWANSAVYIEESTGGVRGGDSANFSSDNEEAGDTTKREAPQIDPGECSDAKFFAVRSFGTSCTLSSGVQERSFFLIKMLFTTTARPASFSSIITREKGSGRRGWRRWYLIGGRRTTGVAEWSNWWFLRHGLFCEFIAPQASSTHIHILPKSSPSQCGPFEPSAANVGPALAPA